MRKPNNPMLRQIERGARKAERWQLVRELLGLLAVLAIALLIIFIGFDWLAPAPQTGTIVEDSRGPELKRLYEEVVK